MRGDAGRDSNPDLNRDKGSDGTWLCSADCRKRRRADRHECKERRRARRAERRETRAREREALKRLPRRERVRVWWRTRPLGVTFTVYLAVYLAVATALATLGISLFAGLNDEYFYKVEIEIGNGLTQRGVVDSGPYIYDAEAGELLPAAELALPGDEPYAVFIATGARGTDGASVPSDDVPVDMVTATTDMVRDGKVRLYDWGLNYNEWYPQEEVLEDDNGISYENLARYDSLSRSGRVQTVEMFARMTGADLGQTFGEGQVSNTAYYAAPERDDGIMPWVMSFLVASAPVLAYGGLGWLTFRHFYRVHIAGPLAELAGAADRIAEQDLDFAIGTVRGRELGRLSETLEHMRASLLEAQRELWRTAESRRRLNAAFAHDLRTPITVLKGTVEMAQMRLRRGDTLDVGALDALSAQVARLERYATSMGGLTKLEDRPVECEALALDDLREELDRHVSGVIAARGGGLKLELPSMGEAAAVPAPETAGASVPEAAAVPVPGAAAVPVPDAIGGSASAADGRPAAPPLFLDLPLVEEVLDNLLSNACVHASTRVAFDMMVDAGVLTVVVTDDGPGFTPEALRRGCDPFFSENKSAEHFGLGLNVSSVLCGLHGGRIALANAESGGARVIATFDVRLDRESVFERGEAAPAPGPRQG